MYAWSLDSYGTAWQWLRYLDIEPPSRIEPDASQPARQLLSTMNTRSVLISIDFVFSEWERIFKNPMTTMAVINHMIHHRVILGMMAVGSYRAYQAHHQLLTQPT
jgi:hypothetical protein